MCGIAGLYGPPLLAPEPVWRMVDRLRHRGPDDRGVHSPAPTVVLGSTRLSILDLSPAGQQPMSNEDGRVWVTFNGEVYNFRALRADLERRGHVFRSQTDTEVVVHAYEEWGAGCVGRLRGMFAFAIADAREAGPQGEGARLLLARDPLGIKPLYYATAGGRLLFASEVRALLASGLAPRRLSTEGLAAYLLWGSVAEPLTLVDGVRSLPPGHRLTAQVNDGALRVEVEPYWRLPVAPAGRDGMADSARDESVAALRRLLAETVGLHLVADVPVGVFLSGGVDSTCVATLAAEAHGAISTVTVTFPEEADRNEAALARETARRLGTRHHEVVLTGQEALRRLDEAVAALDQPSMDGINTYFVSWGARQAGLKVALSGLGGDELFGGYTTFVAVPRLEALAALARRAPLPAKWAARATRALPGLSPDARGKVADLLAAPDLLPHPYALARALFPPHRVLALLNGTAAAAPGGPWADRLADLAARSRELGPFGRVSTLELGTYLVNTLLRDTDAMSMAHSLEVRVPFIDREVVEFVASLPDAWRAGRLGPRRGAKALLLEALGDRLPEAVVRGRKRTFTLPWERWLRGPLRGRVEEGIEAIPEPLRLFLDPVEVRAVWRDFLARRTGWSRPWALYVLNEWVRRHLVV
ncbi:MAG: asparagine synthase (glutamine-hydrolyzing) [Armatimonadota bacterium]|nr:asparagine synthase (glutamine-hydrolyzing) [Armatimonadota bacterium]